MRYAIVEVGGRVVDLSVDTTPSVLAFRSGKNISTVGVNLSRDWHGAWVLGVILKLRVELMWTRKGILQCIL